MSAPKHLGIFTSGGDCAGLNAVIRSVVLAAHQRGWSVTGIREGTDGLQRRPMDIMPLSTEFGGSHQMLLQGGTILGSLSRGIAGPHEFLLANGEMSDLTKRIVDGYKQLKLDALVVVGGDSSLRHVHEFAKHGGMNIVGVPKTMDNDVAFTDFSVGFDTAFETATEALENLYTHAQSHNRMIVVEAMGRDCGAIALYAGIAGGADIIVIPEIPYQMGHIIAKVNAIRESGRKFGMMIVSEGVKTEDSETVTQTHAGNRKRYGGIGQYFANSISEATGMESRTMVLGHLQRGGSPSHHDRILATMMGTHAVELVAKGKFGRMVTWKSEELGDVSIEAVATTVRNVDPGSTLVRAARNLGISFGDTGPFVLQASERKAA